MPIMFKAVAVAVWFTGLITLYAQQPVTTFILVRHAEKDMTQSTPDPDLSVEGRNRALRLAAMLQHTSIAALFSTPFARTRQTVEPLARHCGLPIQDFQLHAAEELDRIFRQYAGKIVLLCGHSNTVPAWVNYLTGSNHYQVFDDTDYGNIIVVSVTSPGTSGNVIWLRY